MSILGSINRSEGAALVTIIQGYRYLGDVQNRWLSTGGRVHNFIFRFSRKTAQNYLPIDSLIYSPTLKK